MRDSAGIRIIEYPSLGPVPPSIGNAKANPLLPTLRHLPPAFKIESKPFLDLGGPRENEVEEFDSKHPMLSATVLSNGDIVVNDRFQLKFFTATGKFLRTAGRRGQGPGEFQQIREVCRLYGDSLLVVDYVGDRMSIWDRSGHHLKTFARTGPVAAKSCRPDGSVLIQDMSKVINNDATGDKVARTLRIRPDGSVMNEVGLMPTTTNDGPFVRIASEVAMDDELVVGGARRYEFRILGRSGRPRVITRLSRAQTPISDQDWRDLVTRSLPTTVPAATRNAYVTRAMAEKPSDAYCPAYLLLRADASHRIWVSDYPSQSEWTVFDSTGLLLGRVELGAAGLGVRKQIVGIERDFIVVLEDDFEGAVHLRYYHFTPLANAAR